MATLCGWASCDERGKISGGAAGDQTGKEVKTGNYYNFGQKVVLRWKDREKAKKYAQFIKKVCDNSLVGYDQIQKMTLSTALSKVDWDVDRLKTKCEVDCSELTRCGLFAVGVVINSNIYTGNMVRKYMETGEFEKLTASKYLSGGDYNLTGDIVVKECGHTISVLEDGSKVEVSEKEHSSVNVEAAKSYNKAIAGVYSVNTKADPLALRTGAGAGKTKIFSMKKGTKVKCYGYYTMKDNVKWLLVVCDGQTGYASEKYLKKR